jgi:hypothetical protein
MAAVPINEGDSTVNRHRPADVFMVVGLPSGSAPIRIGQNSALRKNRRRISVFNNAYSGIWGGNRNRTRPSSTISLTTLILEAILHRLRKGSSGFCHYPTTIGLNSPNTRCILGYRENR